jgi:CRP/FNR family transcriptional regulator
MTEHQHLFKSILNKEINTFGMIKSFTAGTVVVNLHAYIKSIPIVLSGSIKVVQTDEEGREMLLYYIKPGESCIMSILASRHNDQSKIKAIIEEDAELLLIPPDKASEWVKQYPEWTNFIFTLYQKRFESLLEVVHTVSFQKADVRLINLLKQKSLLFHTKDILVTHQQLADELGFTRESVSRALKQMEREKLLTLSRNKISLM